MQSLPLRAWKLGLTTSTWSQVWHGYLNGNTFLGVRLGTCVDSWVEQKARHKTHKKKFAYNNQGPTSMTSSHITMVSRGLKLGFASMLGLAKGEFPSRPLGHQILVWIRTTYSNVDGICWTRACMCQVATLMFSNLSPPTNVFLHIKTCST